MPASMICAFFFTVTLLVTTAYFIFGAIPLLILKHDTPLDARFVRGFFGIYYRAAIVTATSTSVSYVIAGRAPLAAGAAGLVLLALALRRRILPRMEHLGLQIQGNVVDAVPGFRKTLGVAILLNIAQLAVIVWSLIAAGL